jgi:putative transposase
MKLYRTTAHSKYDLKAHIVFLPKYRKRVLHGKLAETIRDLIRKISTELDVHILSGKIAVDHVHLFVSYPPYLSVSDMVQKIKGKSAHHLLSIPEVRKIYW